MIVGRDHEEQAITSFIQENISRDQSGLLYVCGHPGQGKTAVLNQVLFDVFGDLDSSLGGISEELYILKYNAMRYGNAVQFAQSLSQDLAQLIDFEYRRGVKPIKTLRKRPYQQQLMTTGGKEYNGTKSMSKTRKNQQQELV